eukprot:Selendium_serpulae@DN4437_c0_g1_i2.p1
MATPSASQHHTRGHTGAKRATPHPKSSSSECSEEHPVVQVEDLEGCTPFCRVARCDIRNVVARKDCGSHFEVPLGTFRNEFHFFLRFDEPSTKKQSLHVQLTCAIQFRGPSELSCSTDTDVCWKFSKTPSHYTHTPVETYEPLTDISKLNISGEQGNLVEIYVRIFLFMGVEGNAAVVGNWQAKTNSFKHLSRQHKEFLESGEAADTMFCINGREVPVHSQILAARAPKLRDRIPHDFKVHAIRKVTLNDYSFEAASRFIHFLYTGDMPAPLNELSDDDCSQLCVMGLEFDVLPLVEFLAAAVRAGGDLGRLRHAEPRFEREIERSIR